MKHATVFDVYAESFCKDPAAESASSEQTSSPEKTPPSSSADSDPGDSTDGGRPTAIAEDGVSEIDESRGG